METDPLDEKIVCFFCDYGLFLLAILFVLVFGLWRLQSSPPQAAPLPVAPTAAPLIVTPIPSQPAGITENPIPPQSPTSTPQPLPAFTLAFIPLNWQGSRADFEQAAHTHAQNFSQESGISSQAQVQVILLDQALDNQNLSDSDLIYAIMSHAVENNVTADRYIGLTDGDLSPEGISDVVGWTAGNQAMVVEFADPYVTTHELGHTFGLCDEYSYSAWTRQNGDYSGGCPNPYPENCPQVEDDGVVCDGQPNQSGENSIMGPAGMPGEYSFNEVCLAHLQAAFQELLNPSETIQ